MRRTSYFARVRNHLWTSRCSDWQAPTSSNVTTTALLLLCSIPLIGVLAFLGTRHKRRETQAMRDIAGLLDGGAFVAGNMRRGPRATGQWKGVDVSVAFFGRVEPPVFLTAVTAARRPSPFAALLVPRTRDDAPEWLVRLDRMYDAGCAPKEMFRVVIDQDAAECLAALENTEIEILPSHVNIQRREVLYEANQLVPLLDVAVQVVARLDALREHLTGPTEADETRRAAEVTNFLNAFRR